jgi:23S rRNA pseudouridine1911/1915/1917 synthase
MTAPGVHALEVPASAPPQRVDRWVAEATGLSRSHVQKLISAGNLTADGVPLKANSVVGPGTALRLIVPEPVPLDLTPEPEIAFRIVHEDADLLIVDKPAGLVVHPSPGHSGGTLVNALLAHGGAETFGDTSGLIMIARTDAAQHSLMAQLKARRIRKTYLALVYGEVSAEVGRIEAPIGRDSKHRTRMAVVPDGRASTTGYRVRERFSGWTLLELDLVTGRTHQIRVHLDAIGHPVAGDPLYGTGTSRKGPRSGVEQLARLFLHAWRLQLTSPSTGELIRAEAALPDDLEAVLEGLRAGGLAALAGPDGRR